MSYLLDTNIIIYALKGVYPSIPERFKEVKQTDILIPAIVMAELEYGARNSNDYEKSIVPIRHFSDGFKKLDFGIKHSIEYGKIRAYLKEKGLLIGADDMLIAAMALSEDCVLVTHNVGEFSRIPGLKIEDWTILETV